jgi:hypothetical protein
MTREQSQPTGRAPRQDGLYEPPAVIEVFVDPAKDMLVACAPGKLPSGGTQACNAVQFTQTATNPPDCLAPDAVRAGVYRLSASRSIRRDRPAA